MNFFAIYSFAIFISYAAIAFAIDLNSKWCSSCDDPHMHTFDGMNYEFQYSGNFYIMFTDYAKTRVTASFRQCNGGMSTPTCNCGVHVKFHDAVMFLDTCGILPNPYTGLQFFFANVSDPLPMAANCSTKLIPGGSETDDSWWNTMGNAVKLFENRFLCAKSKSLYNTYFVRTNDPDMSKNIYLKVMVHDRGISCIYIRPSLSSFNSSGGLCGKFDDNLANDLSIWQPNGSPNNGLLHSGYSEAITNPAGMQNYWQLDANAPAELPYKSLSCVCPCDNFSLPFMGSDNSSCSVLLSQCLQDSIGVNYTFQDSLTSTKGRQLNQDEADNICNEIFKLGNLDEAVRQNLIVKDQLDLLKRLCQIDLMGTGDKLWAVNQVQIAHNWALETCQKQEASLCSQIKTPSKCLFASLGNLLSDTAPTLPCPPTNRCPLKKK